MSLNRLGIIKEIAERKKRIAKLKMQRKAISAHLELQRQRFLNRNPVRRGGYYHVPNEKTNINHWTDASRYADEYYGETMRETTRFDNDWN
jgi:hypothetical protein